MKAATYYAKRTARFLTHDFGLSAFLNGLALRLAGEEGG